VTGGIRFFWEHQPDPSRRRGVVEDKKYEFVVVGSGAGGATLAN